MYVKLEEPTTEEILQGWISLRTNEIIWLHGINKIIFFLLAINKGTSWKVCKYCLVLINIYINLHLLDTHDAFKHQNTIEHLFNQFLYVEILDLQLESYWLWFDISWRIWCINSMGLVWVCLQNSELFDFRMVRNLWELSNNILRGRDLGFCYEILRVW